MLLALDFDGTYTAHPEAWSLCLRAWRLCGVQVITVTARRDTLENRQAMQSAGVDWPIIFAYDQPKKLAAIEAGYAVDVWIDDNPHGIGDGTENVATQSVFEIELRHALKVIREDATYRQEPAFLHGLRTRLETVLGPA